MIDRLAAAGDYNEAGIFIQNLQLSWIILSFVLPVPSLFFYFQLRAQKKWLRNHPRFCSNCKNLINKLQEEEDDKFLKENQALEESLKSMQVNSSSSDGGSGGSSSGGGSYGGGSSGGGGASTSW